MEHCGALHRLDSAAEKQVSTSCAGAHQQTTLMRQPLPVFWRLKSHGGGYLYVYVYNLYTCISFVDITFSGADSVACVAE